MVLQFPRPYVVDLSSKAEARGLELFNEIKLKYAFFFTRNFGKSKKKVQYKFQIKIK